MIPKFPSNIIKEHSEKLTELLFIQQTQVDSLIQYDPNTITACSIIHLKL